ncbi:MAG: DUF3142 domain-containing protein [Verrucomicrobia bacterium]|nr:DUF3142 domain-containing protein [Verrucomicrobiota bacterium]
MHKMSRRLFLRQLTIIAVAWLGQHAGGCVENALPQAVYIWQRSWTEPLRASLAVHAKNFSALVMLNAEVAWRKQRPEAVRVSPDWAALRACGRPVGLALRIGNFGGPFDASEMRTIWLGDLAVELLAEARSGSVAVAELQLDFDCAESKLDGYRVWVEVIRRRIAPTPLTITALPAWLKQAAFKPLVLAADGFVLQVHSVEKPQRAGAPFVLCDPAAARQAVERAATFGVPFRVALPTYGYTVAFDREGRFIGLSAEGPAKNWPAGAQLHEVRADPVAMATLVAAWRAAPPPSFQGVIWYRLPVAGDRLNWRWPTLAAVMAGKAPRSFLRVEARHPQPGLVEVDLANAGDGDHAKAVQVAIRWQRARLVACDGLRGFEPNDSEAGVVKFTRTSCRLGPGQRQTIGWLRLDKETDVRSELEEHNEPER